MNGIQRFGKTAAEIVLLAAAAAVIAAIVLPNWLEGGTVAPVMTTAPKSSYVVPVTAAGEPVDGSNPLAVTGTLAVTGVATAANQTTALTRLLAIATDANTLLASGGGGYVRQDSTATIAKETGGNLAKVAGQAGVVSMDSNAWVSVSAITGRLAHLAVINTASARTATGTLYGSNDAGATRWVLCDWAGDPIQGRTLTCHTSVDPDAAVYHTGLGFVKGAATSIRWQVTVGNLATGVYKAIGD